MKPGAAVGFIPALYSRMKAQLRCVCVSRNPNLMVHKTLRSFSVSEFVQESSRGGKKTKQALCPAQWSDSALTVTASVRVSGVLVGQEKAPGAVVVRWPERGRPLVVEFSANTARARLSFLTTLCVEHGAAAITPANTKNNAWLGHQLSRLHDNLQVQTAPFVSSY